MTSHMAATIVRSATVMALESGGFAYAWKMAAPADNEKTNPKVPTNSHANRRK